MGDKWWEQKKKKEIYLNYRIVSYHSILMVSLRRGSFFLECVSSFWLFWFVVSFILQFHCQSITQLCIFSAPWDMIIVVGNDLEWKGDFLCVSSPVVMFIQCAALAVLG